MLIDYAALFSAKTLASVIENVSERTGMRLSRCTVSFLRLIMPKLEKTARKNIELVFPEKSHFEKEAILKESFEVLAKNIFGFAHTPKLTAESAKEMCDDTALQLVSKIRERNTGTGILIGAIHFGSFELMFQAFGLLNKPVSVLARKFDLPRFDHWWTGRRELFGHECFERRGGYKEVVRRLKLGQDVTVLFDQNVKQKHATFINFLGHKASASKLMGLAALETGCPIVFVANVETSPGRYTFFTEEIANPITEPGTRSEKVQQVAQRLHLPLEKLLTRYPAQWFWIHRRFKTRPLGEAESLYS